MKEEFRNTLKIFMEDYPGFDWKNGKVILVISGCPHICTETWSYLLEDYGDAVIKRWTHDENIMVITV